MIDDQEKDYFSYYFGHISCSYGVWKQCGNAGEHDGISRCRTSEIVTNLSKIDNTKWQYNEEDNVYYQLGIQYCENPADTEYEELAIIVPAAAPRLMLYRMAHCVELSSKPSAME